MDKSYVHIDLKHSYCFVIYEQMKSNLILESMNPKKLMGLDVHQDDVKKGKFPKVIECNALSMIEDNTNMMVQLKEKS